MEDKSQIASAVPESGVSNPESICALYLRVAAALEQSAALAEDHAERLAGSGRERLAEVELERADRARRTAAHGRVLASRMSTD
jgi:hypothetical protein